MAKAHISNIGRCSQRQVNVDTYRLRICLSPGHSSQTQHSTKAKACICPLQIRAFLETGTPHSHGSPFQCKNVYQCRYTFLAWLMLMKWFRCVVWSCKNTSSIRERKFGKMCRYAQLPAPASLSLSCQLLCWKRCNFGSCEILHFIACLHLSSKDKYLCVSNYLCATLRIGVMTPDSDQRYCNSISTSDFGLPLPRTRVRA